MHMHTSREYHHALSLGNKIIVKVLGAPLCIIANSFETNLSIFFISLNRGRKWNESLVKPNLNYQDFFHDDVGQEPGK